MAAGGAVAQYRPALAAASGRGGRGPGAVADYLEPARQAAAWIRANAIQQPVGIAWPSEPGKPETVGPDIYKGNAGTLIFFLELARAAKDASYSEDAQRAADYVIDRAAGIQGSGFNREGLAGASYAILETWKSTGESRYRDAAISATGLLTKRAQAAGAGVTWGPAFDISGGDAGVISYLLYAARTFDRDDWRQLARNAGKRLREIARKDAGGNLYWSATPNFSHGTAGAATVLAQLYSETREQEFLDAALSGAAHLKSIARADRDTFLLYHGAPNGRDLFYLGQCNGPAGSARLFYELYRNTRDKSWLDITERAAGAILKSGIPEQQNDSYPQIPLRVEYSVKPGHLPGFWNNISQCCGRNRRVLPELAPGDGETAVSGLCPPGAGQRGQPRFRRRQRLPVVPVRVSYSAVDCRRPDRLHAGRRRGWQRPSPLAHGARKQVPRGSVSVQPVPPRCGGGEGMSREFHSRSGAAVASSLLVSRLGVRQSSSSVPGVRGSGLPRCCCCLRCSSCGARHFLAFIN
jgi:hypothetical protein